MLICGVKIRFHLGMGCMAGLLMACDPPSPSPKPQPPAPPTATHHSTATIPDGQAVKAALDTVLALARAGNCVDMAPLLAFHGERSSDAWHRALRYEVEAEKLEVEKECAKLQVLVTGLASHTCEEFATEVEDEGEWLIWKVTLAYQDGDTELRSFAFLQVKGTYLLGDIN